MPSRSWVIVSGPALFDKWFEERETQAAESWRIQEACKRFADRTDSGDLCVSAITMTRLVRGDPGGVRLMCEGARYAEIPWINLQANQNQNFQLESLILAQNERWRQA